MNQRIFNILFIAILVTMIGLGIIVPLMPIYAQSLGATGVSLGIIFSGFSLSRIVFMPIIGKFSDKNGRKPFIITGLFLYALVSLFYPFAQSVSQLVCIRLFHGFASAMVLPIAMAYIGDIAKKGEEGRTMATFTLALFLGMGTGPFLGGLLNDKFGLKMAFFTMSLLSLMAFFITLLFLPEIKTHHQIKKKNISLRQILKNKIIRALFVFRMANAIGRGGIMTFLPILAAKFSILPAQIGLLISVIIFITGLFQRLFGVLADRYNRFYLVFLGSLVASISLMLFPFCNNFSQLLVVGALMGIGGAVAMPAAAAIIVVVGKETGMAASMSIFNMAMSVGMMLSPIVLGFVMDTIGISAIFYFAGIFGLLSNVLFLILMPN